MKILSIFLLILAGCATKTQITKFKDVSCENKTNPEIFFKDEKPKKEYEKIALLTGDNSKNGNITEDEIFKELQSKAGDICADALLVQNIDDTQGFLKQIKVIRVIAVKYKN